MVKTSALQTSDWQGIELCLGVLLCLNYSTQFYVTLGKYIGLTNILGQKNNAAFSQHFPFIIFSYIGFIF